MDMITSVVNRTATRLVGCILCPGDVRHWAYHPRFHQVLHFQPWQRETARPCGINMFSVCQHTDRSRPDPPANASVRKDGRLDDLVNRLQAKRSASCKRFKVIRDVGRIPDFPKASGMGDCAGTGRMIGKKFTGDEHASVEDESAKSQKGQGRDPTSKAVARPP